MWPTEAACIHPRVEQYIADGWVFAAVGNSTALNGTECKLGRVNPFGRKPENHKGDTEVGSDDDNDDDVGSSSPPPVPIGGTSGSSALALSASASVRKPRTEAEIHWTDTDTDTDPDTD